jgi:hypothetical protein
MRREHGPQLDQRLDAGPGPGRPPWPRRRRRRISRPAPRARCRRAPQGRGSPGHPARSAGKAAAARRVAGASDTRPRPSAIGMLNGVWFGWLSWSTPTAACFRLCSFRVTRACKDCRPVKAGFRLDGRAMREAASLPGSSSLGLKWVPGRPGSASVDGLGRSSVPVGSCPGAPRAACAGSGGGSGRSAAGPGMSHRDGGAR